jgi:TonB family protein
MKKCKLCGGEFEDKFRFCPTDGIPLRVSLLPLAEGPGMRGDRLTFQHVHALTPSLSQREREFEFDLTLIADSHLARRLTTELLYLAHQLKRAWPSFKRHPFIFTQSQLREVRSLLQRTFARPHVATGTLTAAGAVFSVILFVLVLERNPAQQNIADETEDLTVTTIDFQSDSNKTSDQGIGAGEKGRVGFEKGRGEGSNLTPARARGGGGGGDHTLVTHSRGRLPLPSVIPAPIPTTVVRLPQALPEAGIDLDPALWRNLNFAAYGDPRSKSITPSNGSGDGGGVGTGNGTGIGEGDGPGFGPGRDGNMGGDRNSRGGGGKGGSTGNSPDDDPDSVYKPFEVNTRARVISKPEPQYTEAARRNGTTGTVILRVVFSRTGEITNIRAIQTLQYGLTEKAIAAARQIRFAPATRNGQPVSVAMQLEYNFNLY